MPEILVTVKPEGLAPLHRPTGRRAPASLESNARGDAGDGALTCFPADDGWNESPKAAAEWRQSREQPGPTNPSLYVSI